MPGDSTLGSAMGHTTCAQASKQASERASGQAASTLCKTCRALPRAGLPAGPPPPTAAVCPPATAPPLTHPLAPVPALQRGTGAAATGSAACPSLHAARRRHGEGAGWVAERCGTLQEGPWSTCLEGRTCKIQPQQQAPALQAPPTAFSPRALGLQQAQHLLRRLPLDPGVVHSQGEPEQQRGGRGGLQGAPVLVKRPLRAAAEPAAPEGGRGVGRGWLRRLCSAGCASGRQAGGRRGMLGMRPDRSCAACRHCHHHHPPLCRAQRLEQHHTCAVLQQLPLRAAGAV